MVEAYRSTKRSGCGIVFLLIIIAGCTVFSFSVKSQAQVTEDFYRATSETVIYSSSVWADVNNDGFMDLIGATDDNSDVNSNGVYGRISCYDVHNNMVLWTYTPNPASSICSTPAVADLDGDDDLEIMFGVGHNSVNVPGRVYIIDHLGNYVWHYQPQDMNNNGVPDGVFSSPAVGDLDRDGLLDFVVGGFDQRVYAFKYNSSFHLYHKYWEFHMGDTIYSSPALANIDEDPYLEIMIGIPVHIEVDTINTDFTFDIEYDGGMLVVLNHNGTLHSDFLNQPTNPNKPKTYTTQTVRSSPAVADIDNDGFFEIIHTTSAYRGGFHGRCGPSLITPAPEPVVYAWNHDGTRAWNPFPSLGFTPANACDSSIIYDSETAPAIGDVDLDGNLEVVVGQRSHNGSAKIWVFNGEDGSSLSPYPLLLTNHTGATPSVGIRASPVIANIDDDSYPEIVIGMLGDLMILDRNGYSIADNTCLNDGGSSDCIRTGGFITYPSAAIWDCDCDSYREVSIGVAISQAGEYRVWDMGEPFGFDCDEPPGPWPMFRQNSYHTGLYDPTPPAAVSDLAATRLTTDTIELTWTSPGHNGSIGCAFSYDIRYSVGATFDWDSATEVTGIPLPEVAGSSQSVMVSGVPEGPTYIFGMKALDEVPNISPLSNLAQVNGSSLEVETLMLIKVDADSDLDVDDIELSWTHLPSIDLYNIVMAPSPSGTFSLLEGNVASPAYHMNAVTDDQDHYYRIEVP